MKLDDNQLAALCARATWVSQSGYDLALGDAYAAALAEELGSDEVLGVKPGSAAHVAALASAVMALRASGGKKKVQNALKSMPKPEPVKPKEAPKAEPPPTQEPKQEAVKEPPPPAELPKAEAAEEVKVEESVVVDKKLGKKKG